ncbi:MAG: DUF2188 domain-containing protein [Patescibacteria group bacterium]
MAKNNYWVSPDGDNWKAKKEGASRASAVFDTQKEAESYARGILQSNDGGELITQNQEGEIRSKDTINRRDPIPPRDTEN